MFDFGLGEMMLLGSIALIAIGPKQLPEVAKTVGKFVGELKRYTGDLTKHVIDAREATNLKLMLNQQLMAGGNSNPAPNLSSNPPSNPASVATGAASYPIGTHAYNPHEYPGGHHDPNYNPDQLSFEFQEFIDCYPTSWHGSNEPNYDANHHQNVSETHPADSQAIHPANRQSES